MNLAENRTYWEGGVGWTVPEYEREEVNEAARLVVAASEKVALTTVELDEYEIALYIVNNWRKSHGYPLNTFQINLRNTARSLDPKPLVAQRTKRLISIINKLDRFPTMKLTQMQDLGGCRAIFSSAATVGDAVKYYEKRSSIKHELASKDDYIADPKTSGYRGVHLVYRYFSDKKAKRIYNGLKIEMQLRSAYQHAWATAVETVGMFSGQALKSSLGSAEWQRFFSLMGSIVAMREKCPPVPETPKRRPTLIKELAGLVTKLSVNDRLREYRRALRHLEEATLSLDASYYLLQLNPAKGELSITGFDTNQLDLAQGAYAEAEELVRKNLGTDAVLVSVDSINALQRAYPNYFADTRVFVALMNQALSGHARAINVPPLTIGAA